MKEFLKKLLKLSPIALSKNQQYDIQTEKILKRCLKADSNCIDVGCFKGEILDLMLKYAPRGQHFACEPIPAQFEYLQKKYANQPNCTLLNYAASKQTGTSSFNYVVSNPPYSGLVKRDYDKAEEQDTSIEVKTDLLDNLIPEELRIDLIKIDVEGAERWVLEGAHALISRHKPIVIFEHGLGASEHYDTKPEQVFAYFAGKDMHISTLGDFLNHRSNPFTQAAFERQFYDKLNYYFVAYPK